MNNDLGRRQQGGNIEFEKMSLGPINAVCYAVWNLGWQKVTYEGAEKYTWKFSVAFEVDERMAEGNFAGERFTISKKYTNTFYSKSILKTDMTNWLGFTMSEQEENEFNPNSLIGKPCTLNIILWKTPTGEDKRIIGSISPLTKGLIPLTPELPSDHMPQWVLDKQAEAISEEESLKFNAERKRLSEEKKKAATQTQAPTQPVPPPQAPLAPAPLQPVDQAPYEPTLPDTQPVPGIGKDDLANTTILDRNPVQKAIEEAVPF